MQGTRLRVINKYWNRSPRPGPADVSTQMHFKQNICILITQVLIAHRTRHTAIL